MAGRMGSVPTLDRFSKGFSIIRPEAILRHVGRGLVGWNETNETLFHGFWTVSLL